MEGISPIPDVRETATDLTFIPMTKPGSQRKNNFLVRSHAMRFVRRRQKTESAARKKDEQSIATRQVPHPAKTPLEFESSHAVETPKCPKQDNTTIFRRRNRSPSPRKFPSIHNLGQRDHQLLSHISSLYAPIFEGVSEKFVIWTDGVRLFMGIAFAHNFVMQSLLAWSATHLSWATKSNRVMEEAYQYRARAYRGLQNAIDCFSADNSDAILVASIMMGWQATTTESWIRMIRGTSIVKATIADHRYKSYILEENSAAMIPHGLPAPQDVRKYTHPVAPELMLSSALHSLVMLDDYLGPKSKLSTPTKELISIVQNLQCLPSSPRSQEVETEIQRLKTILFWTPTAFIDRIKYNPTVMLFMAHLHAIALIAQPLADVGSAHFRGLNAAPIQAFYEELSTKDGIVKKEEYDLVMQLMKFPSDAITYFKDTLHLLMADDTNFSFQDTKISMLKVLTSCPVGLWHNSLETSCEESALWYNHSSND